MNIVFIRHAKSQINPNIPITSWGLSAEGTMLAKTLNILPQIKSLDVVYSSLQTKALETAVMVTKNLGIPIKTDNRLTESTSFTNMFVDPKVLEENTQKYFNDKDTGFNNGESFNDALTRFNETLNDIVEKEDGKRNIGIVTHGIILTSFASQYAEIKPLELIKKLKQPDMAIFDWDTKKFTSFFGELH